MPAVSTVRCVKGSWTQRYEPTTQNSGLKTITVAHRLYIYIGSWTQPAVNTSDRGHSRPSTHRMVDTAGRQHIGSWTQPAVNTFDRGHSGSWTQWIVDTVGRQHIGPWTQRYGSRTQNSGLKTHTVAHCRCSPGHTDTSSHLCTERSCCRVVSPRTAVLRPHRTP